MPAALPVDYPGLRLLAAQGHTLDQLAAMAGVSVNTLKARSAREGWQQKGKALELKIQRAVENKQMKPHATSAVAILASQMEEDNRETRLSLSKAARKMAKEAETAELSQAADVLQAAKTAALIHKWEGSEGSTTLNLAFFDSDSGRTADLPSGGPVIDISEESETGMDDPMF